MADNMIERVAMEISLAEDSFDDFPDGCTTEQAWDSCSESWKDLCRLKARAAIKAMREPDERMCQAGEKCYSSFLNHKDTWHHMIDAALNEDGNG